MKKYFCKHCRFLGQIRDKLDCSQKQDNDLSCKNFEPIITSWDSMAQDTQIQALMNRLATEPVFLTDLTSLKNEIDRYYLAVYPKTRKLSIPRGEGGYNDFLVLANLHSQNQAYRDRVTYLTIQVNNLKRALKTIYNNAMHYLRKTYPYEMQDLLPTQTALEQAIATEVMPLLSKKMEEVAGFLDSLEALDTNLTNFHFTLKEVQDNLKSAMHAEPSRRL